MLSLGSKASVWLARDCIHGSNFSNASGIAPPPRLRSHRQSPAATRIHPTYRANGHTLGYLFLAIAILTEVIATSFLKFVSGPDPRWWAYAVVVVGYVVSFVMLSQSLSRGVPLAIGYAIWSAIGVVLVTVVAWVFFKESLTWVQILGMVVVIVGVGLLELGAAHK